MIVYHKSINAILQYYLEIETPSLMQEESDSIVNLNVNEKT